MRSEFWGATLAQALCTGWLGDRWVACTACTRKEGAWGTHQLREEAAHKGIARSVGVHQLLRGDTGHLREVQGGVVWPQLDMLLSTILFDE